ncbi:aminofutalosine synthase MqnE [Sphingobacteriales bacterium UPWRP_1]|nr:aminofutalosine synthase MqnE [Sphingobacteriales bacterium TSM_CSS]PSJ76934.1 aminofutalosine synthase MqnE [Sphingobacteriales bacterium UPWRP_1]
MKESIESLDAVLNHPALPANLRAIGEKVVNGQRITPEEGILLYEQGELGFLGALANYIRERKHGSYTYFNRNFHIEPTNLCVYSCKFCSYSRLIKQREDGWIMTEDEMLDMVKKYDNKPVTEVHLVGGVIPQMGLHFFASLIQKIKTHRPSLHVKAFTPVEYYYMFKKAKVSYREGLQILRAAGLDSIPGGGAEIFDEEVRSIICGDKCTAQEWLDIHETAHSMGIPSNATMLYGHIETYAHRIDHMNRLRNLQDKTGGFNCFIPLKFRAANNEMAHLGEVSVIEDLRNYAVARIYLDNFDHIKAYWPMIGRTTAQLSLSFGVDDIDGTVDDTTKIYSMAGSEEQNPSLTTRQIVDLIKAVGRHPIERDSVYNVLTDFGTTEPEAAIPEFISLPVINK